MRDGFAVIEDAVADELVEDALRAFDEWKKRNQARFVPAFYKQGPFLDRVVNFQNLFSEFKALFYGNKSLILQDYLFGSAATCYTSLFLRPQLSNRSIVISPISGRTLRICILECGRLLRM